LRDLGLAERDQHLAEHEVVEDTETGCSVDLSKVGPTVAVLRHCCPSKTCPHSAPCLAA
jgi:hypothetical protein